MKSIRDAAELEGKRVLIRVDWNVPVDAGKITDDYRISTSLPTIEYVLKAGGKPVIVSHYEHGKAPKGSDAPSLRPIYEYVKKLLPLSFEEDGEAVLLENLRRNPGEKENSEDFARELAGQADVYVNEAFSASHREHASIVGVPKFLPSFAGLRFVEEVEHLSKAFYPKRPFLFILGGAKFDTKIPLIKKFLSIADEVFVGGALAHNFFKEEEKEIGDSLVSPGEFGLREALDSGKIKLPTDMVVKSGSDAHIKSLGGVEPGDMIVDAGPNTLLALKDLIAQSSTVLWNGPLGNYEEGYKQYTLELARILAESGKDTILGGGDTLSAIKDLGLFGKYSFVSTGGGAMLDFLSAGTLPGIEALKSSQN